MSCTTLVAPTIQEMAWCAITMATGGELLAAILLFCVFLYGIYTFKLPMQIFVPVGILLVFIFAGAGLMQPLGGLTGFISLMWIVIILVGALIALTFWELRKG